jgi:hypothetical protein
MTWEGTMRAVEELVELASITAFFVMMAFLAGIGGTWPLI